MPKFANLFNSPKKHAKLRVFTICSKMDPAEVHESLVELLKKFRIHFAAVHVFSEDYDREKLYPETLEKVCFIFFNNFSVWKSMRS